MKRFLFFIPLIYVLHLHAQTPVQKVTFFPLKKESSWTYISSSAKTTQYRVADTMTAGKQRYFVIRNQNDSLIRLMRLDNANGYYYSRDSVSGGFSPEKLFLKIYVKPKMAWASGENRFTVAAVNSDTAINTISYRNVIQVQEKVFDPKSKKNTTTFHWYAPHIGEIAFIDGNGIRYGLSGYPMGR